MSVLLFLDEGWPEDELPRPMSERPKVMHLPDDGWRAQLGEVAADLEALHFRLLGVHSSVPSAQEPDLFSTLRAGLVVPAIEAVRELEAEPPGEDVH